MKVKPEIGAGILGPRLALSLLAAGLMFCHLNRTSVTFAACVTSLSPTGAFFQVVGDQGTFKVNAPAGCNWTATSNASWINIDSGPGTGNDTVSFIVRDNNTQSARQGTITVDGQTFTVTQDGGVDDCSVMISPTFSSFSADAATGTIQVIAEARCGWQAVTKAGWITITSGCCGIGNGTVTYKVDYSYTTTGRAGNIAIGGQSFNVKQKAFVPPTTPNTVRFLEQATWGPNDSLIAHVQAVGFRSYLDEQFAATMSSYPSLPLQPATIPPTCDSICQRDNYSMYPLELRFFTNAMYGQDQLRQRIAWALHKILVVSGRDTQQPSWMSPYLQILDRNAFGNYRQLLYDITLNPAMGRYLDMVTSTRNNPNENYAREVLQLFSVGLYKLNIDGTVQVDAQGDPIPTYDQAVITGFAKAFTGWSFAPQPQPGVINYIDPMRLGGQAVENPNNHDFTAKTLLDGYTIPARSSSVANAYLDLNNSIDNIFNHPNAGPFICKQLIQQLVTSNPSPGYVMRAGLVFNDNGSGVRGDLWAVVKAILLDPEARGDSVVDPNYGKLREPAQLINNMLRAFNARSANGTTTSDGYLNPQAVNMDQDIFRPPTVFSYFSPDFVVTGTNGLLGPEFGILSTATTLKHANFINTIVFGTIPVSTNAPTGTSLDVSAMQALANNPSGLVDALDRLMMHNTMSAEMRSSIIGAVNAVASSNPIKRARTAIYLVGTSSQYQVER